jgi:RNA polymerase sigma-70 factor (ECF subfamily)
MAASQPDKTSVQSPETIEELFAALESPLLSYALRLTGERTIAEDLVQEAFMKLHAQFDEVREPRRWLYRTVHNMALNHRRKSSKTVSLAPASDDPYSSYHSHESHSANETPLPDAQIIRLENIGQVRLSLAALDERSREVVRLKFHEDLSYAEIGARMGLKTGHVGYLLHHALKTIAAELAKTGVAP